MIYLSMTGAAELLHVKYIIAGFLSILGCLLAPLIFGTPFEMVLAKTFVRSFEIKLAWLIGFVVMIIMIFCYMIGYIIYM